MKKITLIFSAAIAILTMASASAQTLAKDSIQVNKFLKEADKGKTIARLFTISDPAKVAVISAYIDAKEKLAKDAEAKDKAMHDNLPGVRYIKGDKTAMGDVMATLKSMDEDKIEELLSQMSRDFEDTKPLALDPEVASALFALVQDEVFEARAVQFLGYNEVAGSITVFEKRLLSGQSVDTDRLFYWIADDGQHPDAIEFVAKAYNRDAKFFEEASWMPGSLFDYMEKAPEPDKAKILNITYDYLDKNFPHGMVPERETDSLQTGSQYLDFYKIASQYGQRDKMRPTLQKVIRIHNERSAKKDRMSENEIDQALDMLYIKQVTPAKQRTLILAMFITPEMFFDGLDDLNNLPDLANDPDLLGKAFTLFPLSDARNEKERFVQSLKRLSADDFKKYAANVKQEAFRKELLDLYVINTRTAQQHGEYLKSLGLVSKPITDADIAAYKKDNPYDEETSNIYSALEMAGIQVNFDTEADEIPVPYGDLLNKFSKASQGKFGPFKSYVQTRYDKKKELYDYRFMVICNNKCFVMVPEDSGDWYDITAFSQLLDALKAEVKMTEQFVPIQTGDQTAWYIFGQPDKVNELVDAYKLAVDTVENEE